MGRSGGGGGGFKGGSGGGGGRGGSARDGREAFFRVALQHLLTGRMNFEDVEC